jgi:2-dehydropantoate 2-reductase
MLVDPIPPSSGYGAWLEQILASYGDLKPSMLQDFERGRRTEIDFINGYVADLGRKIGVAVPLNAAATELAHAIEEQRSQPHPARLEELLARAS